MTSWDDRRDGDAIKGNEIIKKVLEADQGYGRIISPSLHGVFSSDVQTTSGTVYMRQL